MPQDDKFEKEDVPKILATIRQARTAGSKCLVEIRLDANGGVTSIDVELRKKIK